ncbi:MAG: hypothetical protein IJU38_07110 [Clostridia bacterium]|nr:hypothetical protein [Clostridia bacterium]
MAKAAIFQAAEEYRRAVNRNELEALRRLSRLWVPSYKYLREQFSALTQLIESRKNEGKPVEVEYLYSLQRYRTMMEQARKMISQYNRAAAGEISGAEAEAADLGTKRGTDLVNIAEPDDPMWTRVNSRETRIMSGMLSEASPLSELLDKSFSQTREEIDRALITGISTGQGSSWIADQLANAAQVPLQRALVIARTEVNRAYRQANLETMRSSRAVRGYRRMCYPPTACFACLMMDGEYYDKMEDFSDHPNGKCSAVPVTKHFDPGADPNWQRGRDWFMQQDEDAQRKLMGAGRFDLWKQQGIDPRDMVWIKPNPIWGGSPAVRTLGELKSGSSLSQNFPSSGRTYKSDTSRHPIDDTERFAILNNRLYKEYGVELHEDVMLLDYENVEKSLAGVTEVLDKIPGLKNILKGFVATDKDCLMATFDDGTIGFNRAVFGTKESLASEMDWVITEGLGINNFSEKAIGYHEAGHLIELLFSHKFAGVKENAIADYNSGRTANILIQSAIKSMGINYNYNEEIKMAEQISDRALDSTSELFAECIADYMTNGKNSHALSKALWKLIKEQ